MSRANPFKTTVYLRANTELQMPSGTLVSNYVAFTFVVCGNEIITATPAQTVFVFQLNQASAEVDFTTWFTHSHSTTNCHPDCEATTYSLKKLSDCSSSLSIAEASTLTLSIGASNKVVVDSSTSLTQMYLCIVGTTYGLVKDSAVIQVETCGSEIISISGITGTYTKTLKHDTTTATI